MNITAIILAKNEEKIISDAINSVSFCDEIIVVDDYSTDKTLDIARAKKTKVIKRPSEGNFGNQRNFAMEKAGGDWVLFVDADEVVTKNLALEIRNVLKNNSEISSYYIKRRDYFWGRELKYGEVHKARTKGILRLMRKKSGIWTGCVHELFDPNGQSGLLRHYIDHRPHQTIAEFLREINEYSTIRGRELQRKNKRVSILGIIFYPFAKFAYTYFIKLGFLDGASGFAYAFLMSFHSFLVRAKLFQYKYLDNKS